MGVLCRLCANVVHVECIGYVDDVDFVCDDCINSWYSKKENESIVLMEKMKKVIQWVEEEDNVPRYRGEPQGECMKCQEGGQVLSL